MLMHLRSILLAPVLFLYQSAVSQETIVNVVFTQPPRLEVDAGEDQVLTGDLALTLGNDLIIAGGTADFRFLWTDTQENTFTTPTITAGIAGTYYLAITDARNCTARDSVSVIRLTSLDELYNNNALEIFPNPSGGIIHYRLHDQGNPERITVYAADGRIVLERDLDPLLHISSGSIHLTGLSRGLYYIRVLAGTKEFVKSILIR